MTNYGRRPGVQIARLTPRVDDPPAEAGHVLIYIRPVDGILRTLARFSSGTVIIIL